MTAMMLVLAAQLQVLTLDDAVKTAIARQPQIAQAHANTMAANARVSEGNSAFFPQLSGVANYERTTANFAPRPGVIPKSIAGASPTESWESFNYWDFGLTVNQYIWDFGQSFNRLDAAKANAKAYAETEQTTRNQIVLGVRDAYFNARATKALVGVAQDTLKSQQTHLAQTQGFVTAGTYPPINLAQAETNVANAELQLIQAQNNYEVAKAQLNQAMGVLDPSTNYEVSDEWLPPVNGEDAELKALVDEAAKARPDIGTLEDQIKAQQLTVSAVRDSYWPTLGATAGATEAGTTSLAWNVSVGVGLTWNIFQGFLTKAQISEAQANLVSLQAQRDTLLLQVQTDVTQADLLVRAGKASVIAADKAVVNARLQLQLAEERYKQGVGNSVELTDAQAALTTTEGQLVQADYNLAIARAALIRALGRE